MHILCGCSSAGDGAGPADRIIAVSNEYVERLRAIYFDLALSMS